MLNSFWGKFGQRNNLPVTKYVTNATDYVVGDPTSIVSDMHAVSDEMISLTYSKEEEFVEALGNTNPVLAAYTTTQARLKIYTYIEQLLQDRVLYLDTDSVVYLTWPGDTYDIPLGDYLGDMTNELPPGTFIEEFVSGGPKNMHLGWIVVGML